LVVLWGCRKPSNTKILRTYQPKTLRTITGALWFVSNLTLHNDLKIPFVHNEITFHANQHKPRTTGHSYQTISELFHQSNDVRRHQRIWPEGLVGWFQRTIDGWYLTQDIHLTYCLLITLQNHWVYCKRQCTLQRNTKPQIIQVQTDDKSSQIE
jgi:hypothetical protein